MYQDVQQTSADRLHLGPHNVPPHFHLCCLFGPWEVKPGCAQQGPRSVEDQTQDSYIGNTFHMFQLLTGHKYGFGFGDAQG